MYALVLVLSSQQRYLYHHPGQLLLVFVFFGVFKDVLGHILKLGSLSVDGNVISVSTIFITENMEGMKTDSGPVAH